MSEKELKINFRYLTGNIACMSVDSVSGKSVHNDINNEEAIIIFNSLVGEKENCRTVKTLLEENQQLKIQISSRETVVDELQEKIDSMTESYETDAEAKFYEYVEKHESKLQQRIDKAIEYIKKWGCYEEDMKVFCDDIDYYNLPRLLEILKGEPNNE